MSYALTITTPPYILEPHAHTGFLVVAEKKNMPSDRHYDLVSVAFHIGRLKWFFKHETGGPIVAGKEDVRFVSLDEALQLFSETTGLQVPEFMKIRAGTQGYQVYREGKFEQVDETNPASFEPGRKYYLPVEPRFMQVAPPPRQYLAIASEDGFGRLVRGNDPISPMDDLEFWHLTVDQKHCVIRTNLGLPLNPTFRDRDVSDEEQITAPEFHEDLSSQANSLRPRF